MGFANVKPVCFAKAKPTADAKPLTPAEFKAKRQWQIMLQEAGELAGFIPTEEGDSVHALMTGRYDLTALFAMILESVGRCEIMRIATLSFNAKNVGQLADFLKGKVRIMTLLYSAFHRDHSPEVCGLAKTDLLEGFAGRFRMAAVRNHAKVVTMAFGDGKRLVMEGSANLRTNGNQEQVTIICSKELHDWHAAWIDALVKQHEIDESDGRKTG